MNIPLNKYSYYLLSFLLLLSSCSFFNEDSEVKPVVSYDESGDTITKEKAAKLAQRHIAIRNYNWAEVSRVVDQEDSFRVEFETPQQEVRLLGQRVLMVDKNNGLVSVIKRR